MTPISTRTVENPFPFASHGDPDVDPPVFVERNREFSDLIADANSYLLHRGPGERPAPAPFLVTGPAGSGKTYLMTHVYHQIRNIPIPPSTDGGLPPARPFLLFIRRPLRSFLETYKISIFPALKRILVETRPSVYNRWLLYIIERTGEQNILSKDTLLEVRKNPDLINALDKNEVFRRDLLLSEIELDIKARAPKEDVADFLMVFKHLYDLPLQPLALKWLEGSSLAPEEMQSLQVKGALQTDKQAINLILMLAIILERARVPFFLFLDELDLLANLRRDPEGVETFRSLLLTLLEDLPQYAFVVIAALEESYETMDPTVRGRVRSFKLSNLEASQTDKLLDSYVQFSGAGTLQNLLEDKNTALDMLLRSTSGNPRKLLSLAHLGYKHAQLAGRSVITAADLAEAQADLNQFRPQDIKATVAKVLDSLRLSYAQDVPLASSGGQLDIEFLVPDVQAPELAVYFLTAAYLQSEALKSVNSLVARTRARERWPSLRAEILVVDGYVSRDVGSVLLGYFKYIVYFDPETFESRIRQYLRRFSAGSDKRSLRDSPVQRKEDVGTLRREFGRRQSREQSLSSGSQAPSGEQLASGGQGQPLLLQRLFFRYFALPLRPLLARQLSFILPIFLGAALIWGGFVAYSRLIKPALLSQDRAAYISSLELTASKSADQLAKLNETLSNFSFRAKLLDDLAAQVQKLNSLQVQCGPFSAPPPNTFPGAKESAVFLSQHEQMPELKPVGAQLLVAEESSREFSSGIASLKSAHSAGDNAAFEKLRGEQDRLEQTLVARLAQLEQSVSSIQVASDSEWEFFNKYKDPISSRELTLTVNCKRIPSGVSK